MEMGYWCRFCRLILEERVRNEEVKRRIDIEGTVGLYCEAEVAVVWPFKTDAGREVTHRVGEEEEGQGYIMAPPNTNRYGGKGNK
jgi:hypothetical protein